MTKFLKLKKLNRHKLLIELIKLKSIKFHGVKERNITKIKSNIL